MKRKQYFQNTVARQIKKHKPMETLGQYGGTMAGYALGGPVGGSVGGMAGSMAGEAVDWGARKMIKTRKTPGIVGSALPNKNIMARSKKRVSAAVNVHNERGSTTRMSAAVRRHKKGVTFKAPKKVKVSKGFKAKVTKVLEAKKIHGHVDITSMGYLEPPANNEQSAFYALLPEHYNGAGTVTGISNLWAFSPEWFLSCASVLFNKKGYNNDVGPTGAPVMGWWNDDQLGSGLAEGQVKPILAGTNGIVNYANNAVFNVTNAWEKYVLRNNTGRTVMIKIYLFAPKCMGARDTDVVIGNTLALGSNRDYMQDPRDMWERALQDDFNTGANLAGVSPRTLYAKPSLPQLTKSWKIECSDLVLEPGQSYDYFIKGPTDLQINMKSHFRNGQFMFIQKCMRIPIFVVHTDLVGGDSEVVGNKLHATRDGLPTTGGAEVLVERRRYCRITCPEIAGFRTDLDGAPADTSVQLGFKRPAYYIKTFTRSGGSIVRVDEENPVQTVALPIV